MRHRVKKTKFRSGLNPNKMLVRKLLVNFLAHGHMTTTVKKTKLMKQLIERLVEKTKTESEANRNLLQSMVNDVKLVEKLFLQVGRALTGKTGGYVRITRLQQRPSDGSEMAKIEWAYPVILEEAKPVVKKTAIPEKKVKETEPAKK